MRIMKNSINNNKIDTFLQQSSLKRIGEANGTKKLVKLKCEKCDLTFEIILGNLIYHQGSCPNCKFYPTLTNESANQRLEDRNIELIGNIKTSRSKVEFKCKKCFYRWVAVINDVLTHFSGCPKCAKQPLYNQKNTQKYLIELFPNTKIMPSYQIKEKIYSNGKKIRNWIFVDFRFVLNNKEIFVEYNGIQHYKPIEKFGGDKNYKKQKVRDNWLRKYCETNDIKLIEIDGRKFSNEKIKEYLRFVFNNQSSQDIRLNDV